MKRFLIVDDLAVLRKGIIQIIIGHYPSARIAEAADLESLESCILRETWDVIISGVTIQKKSIFDVFKQLKKTSPALPILLMDSHLEEPNVCNIMKAGASGYLSMNSIHENLITAIETVFLGRKYITPYVAEQLLYNLREDPTTELHLSLSEREGQVFKMLAAGVPIGEIAREIKLRSTTISTYRTRIMEKLKVKSNAQLIRFALHKALI